MFLKKEAPGKHASHSHHIHKEHHNLIMHLCMPRYTLVLNVVEKAIWLDFVLISLVLQIKIFELEKVLALKDPRRYGVPKSTLVLLDTSVFFLKT